MAQSKVGNMGFAKPGTILKGLHSDFLPLTASAVDNSVSIGCFVQTDGSGIKGANGVVITGKVLGIALASNYVSGENASSTYPAGEPVTFAYSGCVAIEAKSVANVGQYVLINNTNGELVFADASTQADHTFTGFRVVFGTQGNITEPQIIGVEGKVI